MMSLSMGVGIVGSQTPPHHRQPKDEDGVEIDKSAPARRAFPMLTGKLKRLLL